MLKVLEEISLGIMLQVSTVYLVHCYYEDTLYSPANSVARRALLPPYKSSSSEAALRADDCTCSRSIDITSRYSFNEIGIANIGGLKRGRNTGSVASELHESQHHQRISGTRDMAEQDSTNIEW